MDRSAARKKWKTETSAGGVVFREGAAGLEILLIEPSYPDRKGQWTFPKGWTDDHAGETHEDTALREVKEEGGVEAEIVADLKSIHYFFSFEGQNVSKTVYYFLMRYLSGNPEDHDHEVSEAKFVPLTGVEALLAYKNDKEIFERAKKELAKVELDKRQGGT
jgi:ADP-ribose pyrophosphatase YjhB (NUDIX family)